MLLLNINRNAELILYFFRVATLLTHLDVMNNTAGQYKQQLIRLQEKVAETQQVM